MEKFEYQIIRFGPKDMGSGKAQERLNQLGSQGWELVSHSATNALGSAIGVMFVFKRKVQEK